MTDGSGDHAHDEDALRARALEVRAALEDLASEMTHAIKTPLAGLVLSSTRISRGIAALAGQEKLQTVVAHMCDAIETLNRVVAAFDDVDFVPPARPREIAVDVLISAARRVAAVTTGAAFDVDLRPDLPAVRVDPSAAGAGLANILEQAARARPTAGKVEVRARAQGADRVEVLVGGDEDAFDFDGDLRLLRPLKHGDLQRVRLGMARQLLTTSGCDVAAREAGGSLRVRVSLPVARSTSRQNGTG